jgi:hypothetical protein
VAKLLPPTCLTASSCCCSISAFVGCMTASATAHRKGDQIKAPEHSTPQHSTTLVFVVTACHILRQLKAVCHMLPTAV